MPRPNTVSIVLGGILLLLGARSASALELVYEVHSEGHRLGQLKVENRQWVENDISYVEYTARTRLRVKALFLTIFSLDSEEVAVVGPHGLERYTGRVKVDGTKIQSTGRREEGRLDFTTTIDGKEERVSFDVDTFDFSTVEGPDLRALPTDSPDTFRVLDLDLLEIVPRTFAWQPPESRRIHGEEILCQVLAVRDAQSHARRWYTLGPDPILVAEEGVDADGPYLVELKKLPPSEAPQ